MSVKMMHGERALRGNAGASVTVKCCICHRLQAGEHWVVEKDAAAVRHPNYSHGYCPSCYSEAVRELMVHPLVAS